MPEHKINIAIKGNSASAQSAIKKTNASMGKMGAKAKGLKGALAGLKANWIGISVAMAGATLITKKLVGLAAFQEKQQILLAEAMKTAGTFTEEAFQENLKYASSLQQVTTFGDEAILGVQRLLTNFGVEKEQMKLLTKATLDLASAKGMDLKSAADLVAKSVGSSTNALTRYGIEVTGAAGSTERMNMAAENIGKIFGGSALAAAQTFSGQMDQMKNALGDAGEEIGQVLIPMLVPLVNGIKKAAELFAGLPDPVKKTAVALAGTAVAIKVLSLAMSVMNFNPIILGITVLVGVTAGLIAVFAKMNANLERTIANIEAQSNLEEEQIQRLEQRKKKLIELLEVEGLSNRQREITSQELAIVNNALLNNVDTHKETISVLQEKKEELSAQAEAEQSEAEAIANSTKELVKNFAATKDTAGKKTKLKKKELTEFQKGEKFKLSVFKNTQLKMFEVRRRFAEAGVNAVVDAASDEMATAGKVAKALIEAMAESLSNIMKMRAIAAFATGNFAAGAGYTAAAIAIKGIGTKVGKLIAGETVKPIKLAGGGVIDEPTSAVGLVTGKRFLLGEAGIENATKITPEGEGGKGDIFINTLILQPKDFDEFQENMSDLHRRTGSQVVPR